MKRNRLLVGCLALLLVLSVGYALFSEQVTVTGTIKGKGDFDVTPTCTLGYSDDLINAGVATSTDMNQKGFGEDSCEIVDGEVQFTTNLDYPGAKRYFTVKVENTGTIPATFDEEKLSSEGLYEEFIQRITTYPKGYDPENSTSFGSGHVYNGTEFRYYNDSGEKTTSKVFKLIDVGFMDSGNYCSYNDSCFKNFESIKTGESIYFVLAFEWPEDYSKGFYLESNQEIVTKDLWYSMFGEMKIPFRQTTLE